MSQFENRNPRLDAPIAVRDTESGDGFIQFHGLSSTSIDQYESNSDQVNDLQRQRLLPFPDLEDAPVAGGSHHYLRVVVNGTAPNLVDVMSAWRLHNDMISLLHATPGKETAGNWDDEYRNYDGPGLSLESRFDVFAGDWRVTAKIGDMEIWVSEAPDMIELFHDQSHTLSIRVMPDYARDSFAAIRSLVQEALSNLANR